MGRHQAVSQTPTPTTAPPVVEASRSTLAPTAASETITHTVQEDDTLSDIALKYGTTVQEIQAVNGLATMVIYPGQMLTIPVFTEAAPMPTPYTVRHTVIHTVVAGETLAGVAESCGSTVEAIMVANGLTSDAVHVGQESIIPLHEHTPESPSPPIPIATPTPTPVPTETPTATPRPNLLVEGAEGYSTSVALNAAYQINHCWDANEARLSLAGPPHVGAGSQAIAFWFNIRQAPPNDCSGFERFLATPQDWSGHSHLCPSIENDGSIDDIVIQFGEEGREVWKHYLDLSPGARERCVPLSDGTFVHADWPVAGNGRIELYTIDYYSIYVHSLKQAPGPSTSTICEW
jgi:LysM repeat protein